ncbi:MAG: hypothetical protein AB1793_00100 [Candidatus Thermoplasmatota archaeon]
MLAVTHLVVSLLLISLLNLDRNDSFVALLFGVFIDVDHLFGLKGYVDVHGVGGVLDIDALMSADGQWKSLLHSPVAALVVGPVASASRLALPLLFWGVHISMDYAEDTFLGLFSAAEAVLLCASVTALVLLAFISFRVAHPDGGAREFAAHVLHRVSCPLRAISGAVARALAP